MIVSSPFEEIYFRKSRQIFFVKFEKVGLKGSIRSHLVMSLAFLLEPRKSVLFGLRFRQEEIKSGSNDHFKNTMKKSAPPNYLLMLHFQLAIFGFYDSRETKVALVLTPLLSQTVHGMVSPHSFSVVSFRRRRRLLIQKRNENPKLQYFIIYRTSLMKLAIGILILDRPPSLAIS